MRAALYVMAGTVRGVGAADDGGAGRGAMSRPVAEATPSMELRRRGDGLAGRASDAAKHAVDGTAGCGRGATKLPRMSDTRPLERLGDRGVRERSLAGRGPQVIGVVAGRLRALDRIRTRRGRNIPVGRSRDLVGSGAASHEPSHGRHE